MGTEYYIIKPATKQKFYLGRRISYLDGINSWCHKQKAEYCNWENYQEVLADIFENSQYFLERDISMGQLQDFCYAIFEFCNDQVYLDNDCSNNTVWFDYEEIDVYSDILTVKEEWCELINLVPKEKWIIKDNIIYEFETIEKYLQELQYNKL